MQSSLAINPEAVHYRKAEGGPCLLDLGCGDGARAIALAGRSFNKVTGLDATRSLIDLAVQRAAKRRVSVTFVCGDPCATPFAPGSFDEVMLLGDLFGHTGTAKADVQLLLEAGRVLKPSGRLHLSFADGDWTRSHYRPEGIEGLPTGFIYRHRTLSSDGHSLRTEVLSSNEDYGIARQEALVESLYSPREVTELLHRLGYGAITYDDCLKGSWAPSWPKSEIPRHVVHCKLPRASALLRLVP